LECSSGETRTFSRRASELYRLLLGPVAKKLLGKVQTVCIVPDGALWRLPFPLLRTRTGRELVERVATFKVPSISVLSLAAGRRPTNGGSVLALGNPDVRASTRARVRSITPGVELGALLEAETEVKAIGLLYGSRRSEVRVGPAASERSFKREAGGSTSFTSPPTASSTIRCRSYSALALSSEPRDGEMDFSRRVRSRT
jgi:CHAT domain-containing protein